LFVVKEEAPDDV